MSADITIRFLVLDPVNKTSSPGRVTVSSTLSYGGLQSALRQRMPGVTDSAYGICYYIASGAPGSRVFLTPFGEANAPISTHPIDVARGDYVQVLIIPKSSGLWQRIQNEPTAAAAIIGAAITGGGVGANWLLDYIAQGRTQQLEEAKEARKERREEERAQRQHHRELDKQEHASDLKNETKQERTQRKEEKRQREQKAEAEAYKTKQAAGKKNNYKKPVGKKGTKDKKSQTARKEQRNRKDDKDEQGEKNDGPEDDVNGSEVEDAEEEQQGGEAEGERDEVQGPGSLDLSTAVPAGAGEALRQRNATTEQRQQRSREALHNDPALSQPRPQSQPQPQLQPHLQPEVDSNNTLELQSSIARSVVSNPALPAVLHEAQREGALLLREMLANEQVVAGCQETVRRVVVSAGGQQATERLVYRSAEGGLQLMTAYLPAAPDSSTVDLCMRSLIGSQVQGGVQSGGQAVMQSVGSLVGPSSSSLPFASVAVAAAAPPSSAASSLASVQGFVGRTVVGSGTGGREAVQLITEVGSEVTEQGLGGLVKEGGEEVVEKGLGQVLARVPVVDVAIFAYKTWQEPEEWRHHAAVQSSGWAGAQAAGWACAEVGFVFAGPVGAAVGGFLGAVVGGYCAGKAGAAAVPKTKK